MNEVEAFMSELMNAYENRTVLIAGGPGCYRLKPRQSPVKAQEARIVLFDNLSAAEKWRCPLPPL